MTEILENSQEQDGIEFRTIYSALQVAFEDSDLRECNRDSIPVELQDFADDIVELFVVEKKGFDVEREMPVEVCLLLNVYGDGDHIRVGEMLLAVWDDKARLFIDFEEARAVVTSPAEVPIEQQVDFLQARALSALSAVR